MPILATDPDPDRHPARSGLDRRCDLAGRNHRMAKGEQEHPERGPGGTVKDPITM